MDAHLREVTLNFQPYQEIANANMQGDISLLIQFNRKNAEKVFQAQADAIERMYQRKLRFEKEAVAMGRALPLRIAYVLVLSDREIFDETWDQYTATAPLDKNSLAVGVAVAVISLLLLELLMALVSRILTATQRWLNHRWRG